MHQGLRPLVFHQINMIKKQVYAVVRNDPYDRAIKVLYISLTLLNAMEYLYALKDKLHTHIWDWEVDTELCTWY